MRVGAMGEVTRAEAKMGEKGWMQGSLKHAHTWGKDEKDELSAQQGGI